MSQNENQNCKIHNVEQGSEEWIALRIQYPLTASEAQAIASQGKGLETLCWTKIAEKYSKGEKEDYTNKDLARGRELEEHARSIYELENGCTVKTIGFVTNDEISAVGGASPDGDIEDTEGLLEIKCFADVKHLQAVVDFKKTGTFKIETQYIWQMQQQMLFTGKKWVDFIAYNPNFEQSLLTQRVHEDKVAQEKIMIGLKIGEKILQEIEDNLK